MAQFELIYKCKMCGAVTSKRTGVTKAIARKLFQMLAAGKTIDGDSGQIRPWMPHNCDGERRGVSEFVGIKQTGGTGITVSAGGTAPGRIG